MSNSFQSQTSTTARKHHRCDFCHGWIAPGGQYQRKAGKWDGDFYTAKAHLDCADLWAEAYPIYADYGEGMPFDLYEAICGDEARETALEEIGRWRGRYPHVVCRIELRLQLSDQRMIERHRAAGFSPELDPWEVLHS